jgi:hypothetical protein
VDEKLNFIVRYLEGEKLASHGKLILIESATAVNMTVAGECSFGHSRRGNDLDQTSRSEPHA